MSDNIVNVREPEEVLVTVTIGAGRKLVQLPNGFAYDGGEYVELTIEQVNQIDPACIADGTVIIGDPQSHIFYDGKVAALSTATLGVVAAGGGAVDDDQNPFEINDDADFTSTTWPFEIEDSDGEEVVGRFTFVSEQAPLIFVGDEGTEAKFTSAPEIGLYYAKAIGPGGITLRWAIQIKAA